MWCGAGVLDGAIETSAAVPGGWKVLLSLKAVSISMHHTARFSSEKRSAASLHFSVYPAERDHLDLETGEVFQNPRFAKIRAKAETITASLTISEAVDAASHDEHNTMSYFKG